MPPALLERACAAGVPVRRDLRPDRGLLAGHAPPVAPRSVLHVALSSAGSPRTARSWLAGRPWRPAALAPMDGCTPATSARSTPTASCTSAVVRPTRSSAAVRTSRPSEVEAVLEAHPAVIEAAVLGRADPQWGEAVTAIVVASPRSRRRGGRAARALPRSPGPLQGAKASAARRRLAPAHASGKLLRRELQGMSI